MDSKVFKILSVDEIEEIESPGWLVHEVLPAKSLVQIFGRESHGKSFVALDMGLKIASGLPWMGQRPTRAGKVVYVVGEGLVGIRKRLHAWRAHNKVANDALQNFWVVAEPVQLGEEHHINGIAESIQRVTGSIKADLIVFDTQARCTAGLDENSAEDMGKVVAALDWLREETGATIMLIHHSPYNEDRGRGSSAIPGALDTAISVHKKSGTLTLACTKQKDWNEFEKFQVGLVAKDDSAVVIELGGTDPAAIQAAEDSLTSSEQALLKQIREAGVSVSFSVSEALSNFEGSKATFYRALGKLKQVKLLEESDGNLKAANHESQGTKPRLVS